MHYWIVVFFSFFGEKEWERISALWLIEEERWEQSRVLVVLEYDPFEAQPTMAVPWERTTQKLKASLSSWATLAHPSLSLISLSLSLAKSLPFLRVPLPYNPTLHYSLFVGNPIPNQKLTTLTLTITVLWHQFPQIAVATLVAPDVVYPPLLLAKVIIAWSAWIWASLYERRRIPCWDY